MSRTEMEKDVVTIKIEPEEIRDLEIGASSIIGTRKNQEDTIFGHREGEEALLIVCDGMGGLHGGERASKTAVESIGEAYFQNPEIESVPEFLEEEAYRADEKVACLRTGQGEMLHAGTTAVVAVIKDRELYWLSVGDSRIYIIRGKEIMAVNREHNYRMTMDAMLEEGTLTLEEYKKEEYRAEALISYLGIGNLELMDVNRQPFLLEEGDVVLLSSDGLSRSLTEEEILDIVYEYEPDMQRTAEELTAAALGEKTSGQDNTSVVILQYHAEEAAE